MDSNTENRRKAVLAGHSGDYESANLLLTDDDPKVRGAALSSLEKLEMLSGEILEKSVCDPSPEVRKRAVELLAKRPEEIPLDILNDEDYLVVETACWAIGEKENPSLDLINKLCLIADSHEEQLCREAAVAALDSMSIPDEDRESTWKFQEMYNDYINQHARQDASRLNGAYGNAEGVSILPESRTSDATVEVIPPATKASRDDLGADSTF